MSKPKRPTVSDVLGPYLTEHAGAAGKLITEVESQLSSADDDQLGTAVDVEQVHQLRVSIRRVRSVLRVFADVFSAPEAGRLSDDAGWFAQRLGTVRDLDVAGDRLSTAINELDADLVLHQAADELQRQLRQRRQQACRTLQEAVQQPTFIDLADQLRHWQHSPVWGPAAEGPASKVKKRVQRADRRLRRRLDLARTAIGVDDPDTDELIHAARKSGKRHRYAVEAAAPVLGSSAGKVVAGRRELQDLLGDYQDSVQASALLRDLGGIPGRNGFTFGVLYAQEAEHRRSLRKKFVKRLD